ncbi:MAG: beta-propeller fold lactonase family protein [Clostridia bacterium]
MLSVDEDGKLWKQQSVSTHGKHPRDCSLTPQEDFLLAANQNSDHIVSFKRTEEGLQEVDICHGISMPACVLFWQQRVGERAYEKGK